MASSGKIFEGDFKDSAGMFPDKVSIDRFYDVMGGRKGINTPCDFVVYMFPHQYYFELKSYEGERISLSVLTDNQFNGLIEKSKVDGVYAGVLFNFRKTIGDIAVWVPIQYIGQMIWIDGLKSISLTEALEHGIRLQSTKRRTHYTYNLETLLLQIVRRWPYDK